MIIKIYFILLQFIIGLQCARPIAEELRMARQRQAGQRSGSFRPPPMRRSQPFRIGQERPNVPIYRSRSNNQIPPSSTNFYQNPVVNDLRIEDNQAPPILEVEAIEIPIAQAEPITLISRCLRFLSRNTRNRFNNNPRNRVDIYTVEAEADDENIPIIFLNEPHEIVPIRA